MRRMHTLAAAPSMTPDVPCTLPVHPAMHAMCCAFSLACPIWTQSCFTTPSPIIQATSTPRLVLTVVMIFATYRCPDTLADMTFAASQHYFDAIDIDSPACRTGVVPRELLPYGLAGSAVCGKLWRESPFCMDGWIDPVLSQVRSLCIDCTDTDHHSCFLIRLHSAIRLHVAIAPPLPRGLNVLDFGIRSGPCRTSCKVKHCIMRQASLIERLQCVLAMPLHVSGFLFSRAC